ncbi:MAG: histidine triad nucleotide-binding protein [Gemmatimonadaceae bacterium]
MADDCLFCRIVRKEIPAKLIAETADCIAFSDVNPQAPVHVLIIPRLHVASLNSADKPALLGNMLELAADIAESQGVAESGYRTVINTNSDGGQSVYHLHAHLLGGRRLSWPPG